LVINGIEVGSGSIFVSSGSTLQNTGTVNVSNPISNLSGNVTVTLKLFGGQKGTQGTFRMDDFILNGFTQSTENAEILGVRGYRYGFNSMEKDDELKGSGNSYDFGARMYDSRVGRFLSRDPKEKQYSWQSTYLTSANNPIYCIDKDGKGNEPYLVKVSAVKGTLTIPSSAEVLYSVDEYTYTFVSVDGLHTYKSTIPAGRVIAFTIEGITYSATFQNERFIGYYNNFDLGDGIGVDGSNNMQTIPYNSMDNSINESQAGLGMLSMAGAQNARILAGGSVLMMGLTLAYVMNLEDLSKNVELNIFENYDLPGYEILEANPTKVKDMEPGTVVPTPDTEKGLFKKGEQKGEQVNKETGEIWSRSKTTHHGEKWKVWPKGTKGRGKTPDRRNVGEDGTIKPGN
jgi:RHS repeat-associated protein